MRNLVRFRTGDRKRIQQLRRHQSRAENNPQNRSRPHLARNRPDNTNRQHMEHRLANQPKKLIHPLPELRRLRQRLTVKHRNLANNIAEAQNQTTTNQRRNNRCEDFAECAHNALKQILLRRRRRFHRIFRNALNPGKRSELLIKLAHLIANNHLKLSGLRKRPLDVANRLNASNIRLLRIDQDKTHPRHAMRHRADILLAANGCQKQRGILLELRHKNLLGLVVEN